MYVLILWYSVCYFDDRFCVKIFIGYREWVRMVRVYYDGLFLVSCLND